MDTRWRTSRKWSSSQGSAMGPGAAGKPYSSSACRSSSRNDGWLRCATRTTNRLVELDPAAAAACSTHTATCPAGTEVQGRGEEKEKEVVVEREASAARPRDRHRRTARHSHTRDGIVIATLHMLGGVVRRDGYRGTGTDLPTSCASWSWIGARERTGEWFALGCSSEERWHSLWCGTGRGGEWPYI